MPESGIIIAPVRPEYKCFFHKNKLLYAGGKRADKQCKFYLRVHSVAHAAATERAA